MATTETRESSGIEKFETAAPAARSRVVAARSWPWIAGVVLAAALLGPALRLRPLLGLDLTLVAHLPLPDGVFGLGTELPRAVPVWVLITALGGLIGVPAAGTLVMGAMIAVGFVGVTRLVAGMPTASRAVAGAVYVLSPFTLTRLAVGHVGVLAAMAILPWAAPALVRPGRSPRRTLLWAAALGSAGVIGGVYAGVLIAAGLVTDRGRGLGRAVAGFIVGQLPWLVPAIVAWVTSPARPAGTGVFPTRLGATGALALVAGDGFWRSSSRVGVTGAWAGLAGVALLGVALLGHARLPGRRALAGAATVGFLGALATAVPGARAAYGWLTSIGPLVALRESQRLLGLFLLWLAPAVGAGVAALLSRRWPPSVLRRGGVALVAGAVVGLAVPAFAGLGGALEPVRFPAGWTQVRRAVVQEPGTVLALPWHRWYDVDFAGDRRVLNPLPGFLGGDVIASTDPELGPGHREGSDPREAPASRLAERAAAGGRVSGQLEDLGVRWVILAHEVDWQRWRTLAADPGLRLRFADESIEAYEVLGWTGPARTDAGHSVSVRRPLAPLAFPASTARLRWQHPWAAGWMRGLRPARQAPGGLIELPGGRGPVWYWPTLLVVAGDAVALAAVFRALRRRPD